MSDDFSCQVFGKAILAGEHAVLRNSAALVFPIRNFSTDFAFKKSDAKFCVKYEGERGNEVELIFPRLLKHALGILNLSTAPLSYGELSIKSNLPLGTGLGASAALCVGLTLLLNNLGFVKNDDLHLFATQLENLFHGESSGVDVAVALEGQPIKFKRSGEKTILRMGWEPQLYVSYSGQKGLTVDCVDQVKTLIGNNPERGKSIDLQMAEAVVLAENAVVARNPQLSALSAAISMAAQCFYDWDLCPPAVDLHIKKLREFGALAAKPTGSGGGGYVISLWSDTPPEAIRAHLTKI